MPTPSIAIVETDAFCDCGYNLHGQVVWRDERLGLLVCRCPECGRHAAAGRFTGIHAAWLHRLSMVLILLWVVFLLALFGFLTPMCAVWPSAHLSNYLTTKPVPNAVPTATQYVWSFRPMDELLYDRAWWNISAMMSMAALNGLLIGLTGAVCMWHLRTKVYLLVLLPAVVAAFLFTSWSAGPWGTDGAYAWMTSWVIAYALLEMACVATGIRVGRPVARFALSLLLPPRLLQHLAFLWYRDRVPLPAPQKE